MFNIIFVFQNLDEEFGYFSKICDNDHILFKLPIIPC